MAEPAQAPPSEKCKHAWDARLCQGNLVWNTILTCDAQESSEAVQIAWNTSLQISIHFSRIPDSVGALRYGCPQKLS